MGFNAKEHLEKIIIPYWNNLKDSENGGFYGYVSTKDLKIQKGADKGVILHSRILWFYSTVYMTLGGESNLQMATHAYQFIKNHCFDTKNGGLYWMVHADGTPADSTKNTYNQAFGIYGLSAYYQATKNPEALELAYSLFSTIETWCRDSYGYLEAFDSEWKKEVESAICDQGIVAKKSMNTILHVLEAYAELLVADTHPAVQRALQRTLELVRDKLYNSEEKRFEVFFDEKMNSIADYHSYGHDIESSWLVDYAMDVLEDSYISTQSYIPPQVRKLGESIRLIDSNLADTIREKALVSGGVLYQRIGERVDTQREWWAQAEAVLGFVNEYSKNNDNRFLEAAKEVLHVIETQLVDKRPNSEWFRSVDLDGKPDMESPITEAWKCPYHNGRMCLELINRGFSTL